MSTVSTSGKEPEGLYLEPRYPEYVSQKMLTTIRVVFLIPHLLMWLWVVVYQPFHFQFVYMTMIGNTTAVMASAQALQFDNKD